MPCVKDGTQELVGPEECEACIINWLKRDIKESKNEKNI